MAVRISRPCGLSRLLRHPRPRASTTTRRKVGTDATSHTDSEGRPPVSDEFEWQPAFDALLEQAAATNIVECVTSPLGRSVHQTDR